MIKAEKLSKTYRMTRENNVKALKSLTFEIKPGERVSILGQSGSGKSTLLNILGGLDTDYEGCIEVNGKDIRNYNANFYRRNILGTIFQQFYLIPSLTVEENITLPVRFGGQLKGKEIKKRLEYLLERVGLKDRRKHKPNELSGGQAQRVAIARALIANPNILLADEPTGNLDSKTGKEITKLLYEINKEEDMTLVIVSHDQKLFEDVEHKIILADGKVDKDYYV